VLLCIRTGHDTRLPHTSHRMQEPDRLFRSGGLRNRLQAFGSQNACLQQLAQLSGLDVMACQPPEFLAYLVNESLVITAPSELAEVAALTRHRSSTRCRLKASLDR
jgi:hypothetical protein